MRHEDLKLTDAERKTASPVLTYLMEEWSESLTDDQRRILLRPLILGIVATKAEADADRRREWAVIDWLVHQVGNWFERGPHDPVVRNLADIRVTNLGSATQAERLLNKEKLPTFRLQYPGAEEFVTQMMAVSGYSAAVKCGMRSGFVPNLLSLCESLVSHAIGWWVSEAQHSALIVVGNPGRELGERDLATSYPSSSAWRGGADGNLRPILEHSQESLVALIKGLCG